MRGKILAAGLICAVSFAAVDARAQAKKEAPLELQGGAAQTPWKRYGNWPQRDGSKWSTLGKISSPPAAKEPRKITAPITGNAENGAKLVADRNRGGSCLACHVMGPAGNVDLPGNVGPDLSEIGNADRADEWLFNYVYDARVYNPETVMPPWGSHGLFKDEEINDIVAFLKTLKKPAVFKTDLDNPDKRPPPVEKRENLDPLENPGMWAVEKSQELWKANGPGGSSCATCHATPETTFKTWASS
ncbi:MAG: sulfur oxidation c-type cytochrome SoxX, partial [Pseudolabrys sp.]|nr:sulfur oxidation c-type cytochrome SoxX [Pseudolabrys sp.]